VARRSRRRSAPRLLSADRYSEFRYKDRDLVCKTMF
jgi:hypothetical protein